MSVFGALFWCEIDYASQVVCFLIWINQTANSLTDCIILQQRSDFDSFWFVLIRKSVFWNRKKKFLCEKCNVPQGAVFLLVSNHPNDKQLCERFHFSTSESLLFSVLLMFSVFCSVVKWSERSARLFVFLVWIIQTTNSRTDGIILQQWSRFFVLRSMLF